MPAPKSTPRRSIPPAVAEQLGSYVYVLVDPRDDEVFYVGKGKGSRCLTHLKTAGETRKNARIDEIHAAGCQVAVDVLVHGLEDTVALSVEAAAIDLIGLPKLTNEVRGRGTKLRGRARLDTLIADLDRQPVEVHDRDRVILFRVSELYRASMSPLELYDITRGVWAVNLERAQGTQYALAIFDKVVREVYEVAGWFPAGSTMMTTREDYSGEDRYEFVGKVAPDAVRRRYLNRSLANYLEHPSPFTYVNC